MTSKIPELTQLERVKSIIRYFPAKGTAGLARLTVRTLRRAPSPPAMMTARVFIGYLAQGVLEIPHQELMNGKQEHIAGPTEARRNLPSCHWPGSAATSPGWHRPSGRAPQPRPWPQEAVSRRGNRSGLPSRCPSIR